MELYKAGFFDSDTHGEHLDFTDKHSDFSGRLSDSRDKHLGDSGVGSTKRGRRSDGRAGYSDRHNERSVIKFSCWAGRDSDAIYECSLVLGEIIV